MPAAAERAPGPHLSSGPAGEAGGSGNVVPVTNTERRLPAAAGGHGGGQTPSVTRGTTAMDPAQGSPGQRHLPHGLRQPQVYVTRVKTKKTLSSWQPASISLVWACASHRVPSVGPHRGQEIRYEVRPQPPCDAGVQPPPPRGARARSYWRAGRGRGRGSPPRSQPGALPSGARQNRPPADVTMSPAGRHAERRTVRAEPFSGTRIVGSTRSPAPQ